jgi:hypothetical protein
MATTAMKPLEQQNLRCIAKYVLLVYCVPQLLLMTCLVVLGIHVLTMTAALQAITAYKVPHQLYPVPTANSEKSQVVLVYLAVMMFLQALTAQ